MVAMALFFRTTIVSGFDLGFGDRADSLIEISILEHWRSVLIGAATWDTTGYFYPYPGTLGYNDGYFLFGMVYSFWRVIADPFLADTLNIFTFKAIGFFAAYALVSRSLGWGRSGGLFVALFWTIANGMVVQAGHAQLHSIGLLPVAMMLAIAIVRAERCGRHRRSRSLGIALAALIAAWLLTAYYMAWFTIFFAALFTLCWCGASGRWRLRLASALLKRHWATLAISAAAFALFLVPFVATYLPKIRETGGHSYWKMLGYLVTPVDLINVGPENYMWGWLFRPLLALVHAVLPADPGLPDRVLRGEHETGFPLILFVLIVTAAWRIIVRRRAGLGRPVPPELRAFALAIIISWILTLQFWVLSPWGLVFELVPGAKGLRVVSRYQLFLILPVLLLVVAAHRDRAILLAGSRPWFATLLMALLMVEQLNAESPAQLSRSLHHAELGAIPAPPSECRSFYVVAARRHEPLYRTVERQARYPHNVDAMFLAEQWRLPTIGGYSTFNPPDWNFADPLATDYDARAAAHAKRHGLRGMCRLDMRGDAPWRHITPVIQPWP
jgi:hypothetical protein